MPGPSPKIGPKVQPRVKVTPRVLPAPLYQYVEDLRKMTGRELRAEVRNIQDDLYRRLVAKGIVRKKYNADCWPDEEDQKWSWNFLHNLGVVTDRNGEQVFVENGKQDFWNDWQGSNSLDTASDAGETRLKIWSLQKWSWVARCRADDLAKMYRQPAEHIRRCLWGLHCQEQPFNEAPLDDERAVDNEGRLWEKPRTTVARVMIEGGKVETEFAPEYKYYFTVECDGVHLSHEEWEKVIRLRALETLIYRLPPCVRLICEHQQQYLETGNPLHLKPLSRLGVTERLIEELKITNLDHSTIYRLVDGKQLQTPRGMISLIDLCPTKARIKEQLVNEVCTVHGQLSSRRIRDILRTEYDYDIPVRTIGYHRIKRQRMIAKTSDERREVITDAEEKLGLTPGQKSKIKAIAAQFEEELESLRAMKNDIGGSDFSQMPEDEVLLRRRMEDRLKAVLHGEE